MSTVDEISNYLYTQDIALDASISNVKKRIIRTLFCSTEDDYVRMRLKEYLSKLINYKIDQVDKFTDCFNINIDVNVEEIVETRANRIYLINKTADHLSLYTSLTLDELKLLM